MVHITEWQVFVAQFSLSMTFTIGYFLIIILMMTGHMDVPETATTAFVALLGVLTAGEGTILGYWFSRQRQSQPADDSQS